MPSRFPRATSIHLSAAEAPPAGTCYLQEERAHPVLLPASLISLSQVVHPLQRLACKLFAGSVQLLKCVLRIKSME